MRFDFATAARILFAPGIAAELPAIAREFGSRALVVTGSDSSRWAALTGFACERFAVAGEPTVDIVREGVAVARKCSCDVVISFGGGSAIDAGKAIAIMATNSGEPLDYLEVVGRGQPIEHPGLPYIAVPTTAGTGSEVTRNAVLGSPQHGVKASLRSPMMLARAAVIDPDLTLGLPPAITASTGLDALTQLIEPYVSSRANAMVDLFCIEGMRRVAASLTTVVRDGNNRAARESMSFAALLGGLSLANSGLGVVHGFAAPIGGMVEAAHGAVCAALLPHGMAANIQALRARAPQNDALRRYGDVARILTGQEDATPEEGVEWVRVICAEVGIQPLGALGVSAAQVPDLVAKAAKASSMKANPIVLTPAELTNVLELAMGVRPLLRSRLGHRHHTSRD
jgi:alcohol dehydrogenase class IV